VKTCQSVTTKIKLIPTEEQHQILKETMIRFNEACNYISQIAYEHQTHGQVKVHKLCYHDVREKFGLSSQMGFVPLEMWLKATKQTRNQGKHIPLTSWVQWSATREI
jgi:predicted transposase